MTDSSNTHSEGHKRNRMLATNILLSGVLKAVSLGTSLLIVPVTLDYLDKEPYGIWMTISSMAFWIFTFDIGLGNGLRNYLAAAIAAGDYKAGRTYISSTFVMLSAIALLMAVVLVPLIFSTDFNQMLNTRCLDNGYLQLVIVVALLLTLLLFVAKNIGFVFVALQKYAVNDLLVVGGSVLALIIIYVLTKTTQGNLLYVVAVFMAMPVVVYLLGAIPLFARHPRLRPSLRSVDVRFSKGIVEKGLGFFFIQITSCLVIFGGSNLFISHFQGPEQVTIYNIAYKYFNLLVIGYTIIIAPMWNAYTDAQVKGDWQWIGSTFGRALLLWAASVAAGLVMLWAAPLFYRLWVGSDITVPLSISASVLAFITFFNLNNCVTYLLNGLNTIRVQMLTSVVATAAYLSVVAAFGTRLRTEGIVLSMAACYAAMSLTHLYQCRLIVRQKATGIWKK